MSKGDRRAFEWLFLQYQPKLVLFLSKMTGDDNLAEDMAQDIFFDIWKNRKRFANIGNFPAYLFQMARFSVYNHYDKIAVSDKFVNEMKNTVSESHVTEDLIFARQLTELIRRTADEMPPRRRKVFMMSRFHGYSNDEISEMLGIDKRTVENHLTTALAALREMLNMLSLLCVILFETYF